MQLPKPSSFFALVLIMMCMVVYPFALSAKPIAQEDVIIQELVITNTDFALDFFQVLLANEESNFVFSPYSLSNAFAMTFAGARGNTAAEIAEAFYFYLSEDSRESERILHNGFSRLNILLNNPDRTSKLVVANALWGEQDFSFSPEYQQLIITNYANGFRLTDFKNNPSGATQEINQWISQQTEGKIAELIPEGAIDNLTRLVLTNAILFKADWLFPFDSNATTAGDFYTFEDIVTAQMMKVNDLGFSCVDEDYDLNYVAVRLRYADEATSFLIIMPNEKDYNSFYEEFDGAVFTEILYTLTGCFGSVTMPKFSLNTNVQVKQLLMDLGVIDAFSASADFSAMTNAPEMYISEAIHQAAIDVTEKGTEAAAATAVIMGIRSGGAKEFIIDRPFIFAILDDLTDTVLFMGHVVDPTQN